MQLATYIKDLLYRYECVILPGFGAFLTQYHSATIDATTQTFTPPGKKVSFNRMLQTNDGLLANYVASVEKTTYEEALQKIRNYTGTVSLSLAENRHVALDGIGEFVLNDEHNVQFAPQEGTNFSTASFGLSTITTSEIFRDLEIAQSKDEAPILFTPESRSRTPYLKYAAVGVIALMVTGLAGMKIYENGVKDHNYAQKQEAENLVNKQIQEATFVFSNPLPAVEVNVPKQTGRYHIVAGAFRVEENAQKKIDQLQERGFDAKNIGENRYGLHQVIYNSYETRKKALQALRSIKRNENKGAWLLVQNLD